MKTAGTVVREPFRREQPEMAVRLETGSADGEELAR